MEFFFEEHWRWDWGFGNPNKSATLIGMLFVLAQMLRSWQCRKAVLGLWFLLSLSLGISLIHTYSRGGLLALLVGTMIYWALVSGGRFRVARGKAGLLIAILSAFLVLYPNLPHVEASKRYLQGWAPNSEEDRSIGNRLRIWRDVPRMMRDAPGGWGIGNSGNAWTQYYQPLDTRYHYRTLVSSHFTWLVEFGWIGRFLYLLVWGLLCAFAWRAASASEAAPNRNLAAVTGGAWAVLGVSSLFSSVAEAPLLWVIPMVLLLLSLWKLRKVFIPPIRPGSFLCRSSLAVSAGAATLLMLACALGGTPSSQARIHYRGGIVYVGEEPFRHLLYAPDQRVVGNHYGMSIREQAETGWIVAHEPPSYGLPGDGLTLVLSGVIPEIIPEWTGFTEIALLNPIQIFQERNGQSLPHSVFLGTLRRDTVAFAYSRKASKSEDVIVEMIPGSELYISHWTQILSEKTSQPPP